MLLAPISSACAPFSDEGAPYPLPAPTEALSGPPAPSEGHAFSFWPWADTPAQQPPPVQPYRLPTLQGDKPDFRAPLAPLVKAPAIDAEAVYAYVLACYPERSQWNLDVDLRAQLANLPDDVLSSEAGSTELGRSYVAIVARMPLYSATELNREREREHARRQNTAGTVADFISAIASRNHAIRELALYRSLEARSALRVQQGIAESSEQVGFLEKVANSHETLIKQEARLLDTRLKLAGMCDPGNAERLNTWLKQVARVPLQEPAEPSPPGPLSLRGSE